MSCSRRYSGDSSLPPPFLSLPSSRFCPHCPVRATSVSASPSFDISYFVISAFSVVLCARVLRAHLSLRLSLRPFLRHCMPACLYVHSAGLYPAFASSFRRLPSSFPPDVIRHLLCPLRRMLCGMFCVHCTGYYPPTPDSPYARWSDSRRYSAEFFSSFDISICRISLSRNLRCPARPALSCALTPVSAFFLSIPPSIYV